MPTTTDELRTVLADDLTTKAQRLEELLSDPTAAHGVYEVYETLEYLDQTLDHLSALITTSQGL